MIKIKSNGNIVKTIKVNMDKDTLNMISTLKKKYNLSYYSETFKLITKKLYDLEIDSDEKTN